MTNRKLHMNFDWYEDRWPWMAIYCRVPCF